MSDIKKQRWTESDVLSLPSGEHDYFDRKSGALMKGPDLRGDLAKALSAFANSGGGHLVLGVKDDGSFDGVEPVCGRTPVREWLEQVVPELLDYALQDFRVHEVIPSSPSAIPTGKALLVIDVGDSALAPHQTRRSKTYYYRAGGHSKPAPHFYLETLRNRLVNPVLVAKLADIELVDTCVFEGHKFVSMRLTFKVENVGRIAAHKWWLFLEGTSNDAKGREGDYRFDATSFPGTCRNTVSGIPIDDTLLPSLWRVEQRAIGVQLRAKADDPIACFVDFQLLMSTALEIRHRVITENAPGETVVTRLESLPGYTALLQALS